MGQLTKCFMSLLCSQHYKSKNYMTTSRSLTSGWEAQNTTKQVMNYQWAKQGYVWGNYELQSLTHSVLYFRPFLFHGVQWQFDLVLIWGLVLILNSWENSLCKLFLILCQMNPIQLNPIFSDGFHRFFIPFITRSVFYLMTVHTL